MPFAPPPFRLLYVTRRPEKPYKLIEYLLIISRGFQTAQKGPKDDYLGAVAFLVQKRIPLSPKETKAAFVEPMLLLSTDKLPEGLTWVYELKLDGCRAIGIRTNGKVQLRSRNDKDFARKYPAIAKGLQSVCESKGAADFDNLVRRFSPLHSRFGLSWFYIRAFVFPLVFSCPEPDGVATAPNRDSVLDAVGSGYRPAHPR